jgi:hypothetical protein
MQSTLFAITVQSEPYPLKQIRQPGGLPDRIISYGNRINGGGGDRDDGGRHARLPV